MSSPVSAGKWLKDGETLDHWTVQEYLPCEGALLSRFSDCFISRSRRLVQRATEVKLCFGSDRATDSDEAMRPVRAQAKCRGEHVASGFQSRDSLDDLHLLDCASGP